MRATITALIFILILFVTVIGPVLSAMQSGLEGVL